MMTSIRARLTAWYTAVVVVVLVAAAATVALLQERLALRRLDDEVARLMLTLQGVMRTEFGDGLDLQGAADEARTEVVAPDRVLAVTRTDGRPLAVWGKPVASSWQPPLRQGRSLETVRIGESPGRLLSEPVEYQGNSYLAYVWAPLDALVLENAQLRRTLFAGVLVALLVAAIGGWVVGRQTLRPLVQMAEQARSISEEHPEERLTAPHPTDELGTLATAFNGLLDRLVAVLRAQRQFMADASHELRTPVSVVRSTAQVTLAIPERSGDDYRESMTIVGEQADRLARLVDAMLLLSRAEARGLPLVREVVYLDDIVGDCARALRVLAQERHVRLDTRASDEIMFVGDDRLLRQMVSNLIDNAIRHASAAAGVAAVATREAIEILVTDDGQGVPPADRDRIFQRFVRLGSHYAGAGLGLPIAKWIAEAHGGRLSLRSSGPSGTTFAITLPLSGGMTELENSA
jgi:signal transduction histidine kinase